MSTVYLIGIGGTAMASLAVLLKQQGHDVRGSDHPIYPPMSDFLAAHDITPLRGYDADHLTADLDLVVIGNAVSRGNPEVEAVLDRGLRYRSLAETIRDEFLWAKRSLVIAGTHGKTTTTLMTAWALTEAGVDPSFLVGGIGRNFDSSVRLGRGEVFVIEGDEYDTAFFDKTAKFLKYLPRVVVINALEFDHADIYRDLAELQVAFRRLLDLVPQSGRVLLCADDPGARSLDTCARCPVETFGTAEQATWRAVNLVYGKTETTCDIEHRDRVVAQLRLPMLGVFNVRNALAAVAAAHAVGVAPDTASTALSTFRGVRRRLEVRGVVRNITVYDDFAHHPTAVRATLEGVRAATAGEVWAVFEPRSATACRNVFQEAFAEALATADQVIVAPVYRSTLPDDERLSEPDLVADVVARGTAARFLHSVDSVVTTVATEARPGDCVVVMSNGDFGDIHRRLLTALHGGDQGMSVERGDDA